MSRLLQALALLAVRPMTGRLHQIRYLLHEARSRSPSQDFVKSVPKRSTISPGVHLASLGSPIVGDNAYGGCSLRRPKIRNMQLRRGWLVLVLQGGQSPVPPLPIRLLERSEWVAFQAQVSVAGGRAAPAMRASEFQFGVPWRICSGFWQTCGRSRKIWKKEAPVLACHSTLCDSVFLWGMSLLRHENPPGLVALQGLTLQAPDRTLQEMQRRSGLGFLATLVEEGRLWTVLKVAIWDHEAQQQHDASS